MSRKKRPPPLTRFWAQVLVVWGVTLVMHVSSAILYPRRAALVLVLLTLANVAVLLIAVWRRP